MVRPGVRTLEEHTYGTDLSDAGPTDVAIVFDFHRYRREVAVACRALANAGVRIVAVTDSPFSPLVELADTWVQIEVPPVGPFDSSVPVVLMCELLVAEVAKALYDDATDRIDRIEALWERTEAFI
jgi:DNA-binding MurR/RpiR family transcriptional regulator